MKNPNTLHKQTQTLDPVIEQVKRANVLELDRRFYSIVENIGAITVKDVEDSYEREFWEIAKHLPDPSVRDIESEMDDLSIARKMRNKGK